MFPHAAAMTLLGADRRRHGDDDPQHLGAAAALRVEAARLPGGPGHIGRLLAEHRRLLLSSYKLKSLMFPSGGLCRDVHWLPSVGEPGRQIWQKDCEFLPDLV